MKKSGLGLMILAFLVSGASALADSISVSPSSIAGSDGTVSPTSTFVYRKAILDGQADAVAVLEGKPATDLFVDAKAAAEKLTGATYNNDAEAALAIVEFAESTRNN